MSEEETTEDQNTDMPTDENQEPETSKSADLGDVEIDVLVVARCNGVEFHVQARKKDGGDPGIEYFVNDHEVDIDDFDMIMKTAMLAKRLL